ncbi:MAG: type II toxin-antitoxin system Phd/YefM family antitoxin [Schwartzia succinivorans]|jgi:PHD/YefM family antitoxin component YafN of YafNO toxin-antitoxin module|uniref:type II toxin-antitoxin system Phd/YefM family antitoxin n=1 Tax=Schwartzia succinivorans TaxID=55507 RepID=UPI0023542FB7|nr:type II toxin-antitoxin system Phd/YefM family antitoxin [Schwartzia succinivorans]MBE6096504.1 type II toxin-antitoxin system Phd/YefM family antitoxin [Schwartzia succinivorans]
MSGAISIRPSKDLRSNYAQISALSRKNPVAITVNGKEDIVVLCHDDYMEQQNYITELEAKLAVYAHLAQAADDVKLGRVQDVDAAFDDILSELDGLEI